MRVSSSDSPRSLEFRVGGRQLGGNLLLQVNVRIAGDYALNAVLWHPTNESVR
jgi:hypothetical protein